MLNWFKKKKTESQDIEEGSKPKEVDGNEDSIQPSSKKSESQEKSEQEEHEKSEQEEGEQEKSEQEESEQEEQENSGSAERSSVDDDKNPIRLEGSGPEYLFDEVIDIAGYGVFQKQLTLLAGMGWLADAFEIILLSLLGDYLACEWTLHRWQNSLLTATVFVGMMLGAPLFGVIADNFGRRTALGLSLLLVFVFGAGSALSPDYVTLVVVRSIMGFALGGMAQGITLCCEYYPAKNRGIAGFYLSYFWAAGTLLVLLLAWLMAERTGWKWLLLAASLPALAVLVSIKWYPESVRYYLVSDQHEKAVRQLNLMLRRNGTRIEPGTLKRRTTDEKKGNILDLLRKPHTLTTILFWYIWFAVAFHYYGLVLISPVIIQQGRVIVSPEESSRSFNTNATSSSEFFVQQIPCANFTHHNYVDLMWTSAAEFPGLLMYTILVQLIRRKTLLGVACLLSAVIALLLLVEFNSSIPIKILLFVGRANICAMFQLCYIMTSEAFPTTLRAVSMGSGSAWSRFGGAVVAFATQGQVINDPVSAVCTLSGVILVAGVAVALLPHETKDAHLKDYSGEYSRRD